MAEEFGGEVVIRGMTTGGKTFRPSDWADRLAGVACSMGSDHRLCYCPEVMPVTRAGVRCVVISQALARQDARLYQFLLDFARDNELQVENGRASPRASTLT